MRRTPLRSRARRLKTDRARLAPDAYAKLKGRILERAAWRCEFPACRRAEALDLHHVVKRSHGGADSEDNGVVLCRRHHDQTDAPFASGRLVVTPRGGGQFTFEVVVKSGKWTEA